MRISTQAREQNRVRILACARELFLERGYGATTTRDLARAAGIASGTLFNYFPSKESLALELFRLALERGHQRWRSLEPRPKTLAEDLFALIAAELRELEELRAILADVLEQALSPLAHARQDTPAESVRVGELELIEELLCRHGAARSSSVSLHLYWTLWYGVLGFCAADSSPGQEETLAVLDHSMRLFADSVRRQAQPATEEPQ